MIPESRLHELTSRFQFLEARMSEGAAADEIAALAKEYSDLKPVITAIEDYRQCLADLEEAQLMLDDPEMKELAEEELLIMNAYIIPSQPALNFMQSLTDRGVEVKVLTNSLASHDVPAVNSHYEPWRDDFINAGVALYELRSDPAIKAELVDVPPADSAFTGLHSKTAVVDRRYVFVGSMNLDPRSANINTEMGAFVESPELAEDLARVIERNMEGQNAWQVKLNKKGKPYWVNSDETVTKQPARDGMQRVMNEIFKVGPADQY